MRSLTVDIGLLSEQTKNPASTPASQPASKHASKQTRKPKADKLLAKM